MSVDDKIKVVFEGREEILDTVNTGGDIVKLLGLPTEKCVLIGSTIKLVKKLGQGVQGSAYLIYFPGMGEKLYVVKRADMTLQIYKNTQTKVMEYLEEKELDWNDIAKWQPKSFVSAWENATHHGKVSVIIPPKMCKTSEVLEYKAIPDNTKLGKILRISKGSYVCDNQSFSELLIAIYAGKLYRDGVCVNFFNTYSMFTCVQPDYQQYDPSFKEYYQYTFMDKIDGEVAKYTGCITLDKFPNKDTRVADGIYIQTLFVIAAYQRKYKISHNDLHTGNVFVEFVTEKTTFNNEKLIEADYYRYMFEGKSIYIPAIPVIVKIGDYGLSCKYSKPVVGSEEVFVDGFDVEDGTGAWMPNVYVPQYDSLYFSVAYAITLLASQGLMNEDDSFLDASPLIDECIGYMCRWEGPGLSAQKLIDHNIIKESNFRPVLEKLFMINTGESVLLGPIHKKFGREPPKGSKIITLGRL